MSRSCFISASPVYPVSDVRASVRWYEEVLGFEATLVMPPDDDAPASYAVLERGGVNLHLVLTGSILEGESGTFRHHGTVDAQFMVTELDALFEEVVSAGAVPFQSPQDQFWGSRDFAVLDPDGNKVWMSEPLDAGA